jgi:hypothetical protein
MTRDEARKLYTDISSLVYVFGGDLRQKCLQRGLPSELVDEFIENDKRFNQFLKAHDPVGKKAIRHRRREFESQNGNKSIARSTLWF